MNSNKKVTKIPKQGQSKIPKLEKSMFIRENIHKVTTDILIISFSGSECR